MDADGRRKEARDRRDAAVHEAGHVVVARHVGVTVVRAYIYPVPDALDDYLNRTMWNGDTVLARFDNASPEQLAKIAVAGAIATLSWRGKPIELWKFQMKSFGDWAMCGCQPGRATIEMEDAAVAVYALFNSGNRVLWKAVCQGARRLIENSR
jgi:hypothetical protein